jgi:hypothetical protein
MEENNNCIRMEVERKQCTEKGEPIFFPLTCFMVYRYDENEGEFQAAFLTNYEKAAVAFAWQFNAFHKVCWFNGDKEKKWQPNIGYKVMNFAVSFTTPGPKPGTIVNIFAIKQRHGFSIIRSSDQRNSDFEEASRGELVRLLKSRRYKVENDANLEDIAQSCFGNQKNPYIRFQLSYNYIHPFVDFDIDCKNLLEEWEDLFTKLPILSPYWHEKKLRKNVEEVEEHLYVVVYYPKYPPKNEHNVGIAYFGSYLDRAQAINDYIIENSAEVNGEPYYYSCMKVITDPWSWTGLDFPSEVRFGIVWDPFMSEIIVTGLIDTKFLLNPSEIEEPVRVECIDEATFLVRAKFNYVQMEQIARVTLKEIEKVQQYFDSYLTL